MDLDLLIENIKKFSKAKGIPPTTACSESGAGKDIIANMLRGVTPSIAKVQLLATYLGVTTSELLGETDFKASGTTAITSAETTLEQLLAEGYTPEQIAKAQEAMQLLAQLEGPYYQRAKDHLDYLLARQAEEDKKGKK